jgi:hypothetical protein
MRSFFIFSLLCLFTIGCGRYFAPDRNVKEALAEGDVVGRWKMMTNSLKLLTRDGFRSLPAHAYTITFRQDGSCLFQSVEAFGHEGTYILASGTWKLGHDIKRGESTKVKNAIQMQLELDSVTHFRELNFTRQDGVLRLWESYGDPDEWEFIEYVRDG